MADPGLLQEILRFGLEKEVLEALFDFAHASNIQFGFSKQPSRDLQAFSTQVQTGLGNSSGFVPQIVPIATTQLSL